MATLIDEFKRITSILNQKEIDYAICGGWAMAIHGLPRATVDIDFLIQSDRLKEVWSIAAELGYDVESLPLHFADGLIEIRRISKVDNQAKRIYKIDLLLVTDGLREIWDNRELIEWEEGKVWVVSKNGLVELKRISGREQDLLDIRKLNEVGNEG